METTSMPSDSTPPTPDPAPDPALDTVLDTEDGEIDAVEIALVWVHLPTGAAAVQGIVRHPDGGPIVAGSALRDRPVGAGGVQVLFQGTDPSSTDRAPLPRHMWAITSTAQDTTEGTDGDVGDTVGDALAEHGWRLITRAEATRVLVQHGYQLRTSGAPGHVLHDDQADSAVWHDWVAVNGRPFIYVQVAFVTRPTRPPSSLAEQVGTRATEELGGEPAQEPVAQPDVCWL